ncbi:MAG TPA: hypothetical protein VNR38_21905 [Ureibacillus sp.]|nr:hypothetical protein [Ureibacillus sp.]
MSKVRYLILIFSILILGIFLSSCSEEKKMALPDGLPEYVLEDDFNMIDWERKAVNFDDMLGNQNIVGVIGANMPSLNGQKWMWHLWGIDEVISNELTVVGYHKETQTVHPILMNANNDWTITLGGKNNGADAHVPSAVKFTDKGDWALLLYVDDQLFDILVVNINE